MTPFVTGSPAAPAARVFLPRVDRDLDFGYGWSLDFGQPEQDVAYAEGTTAGLGSVRQLLENSRVAVTLLDGTVERERGTGTFCSATIEAMVPAAK